MTDSTQPIPSFRTGAGYNIHELVEGRDLYLGGIKIEHTLGLSGHSDAGVLIHAVYDALLGAANIRNIGYHFPGISAGALDMDSRVILHKTINLLATKGYRVGNVDVAVCAERSKIDPHIPAMCKCLSDIIGCDIDVISIKATTSERMGFVGCEDGMATYAVCMIVKV